jgi:hypothetical protein
MLKDLTPDEMEFGWSYKKVGEVQTDQYLIISRDKGILLDPGGIINFPMSTQRHEDKHPNLILFPLTFYTLLVIFLFTIHKVKFCFQEI